MGRLIDADALKKDLTRFYDGEVTARELIDEQPTVNSWISVKDKLPVEAHSFFYQFYGTNRWSQSMWREQSHKVLVTVAFKDGSRTVTTGETHDGVWNTTVSRTLEPVVTHWQALPEPPKEDENE